MKWYYMKGPGGTIACKGSFAQEAVQEAAERWGCGTEEITVTGEEPYHGSDWSPHGAQCAPLQKEKAAAEGKAP